MGYLLLLLQYIGDRNPFLPSITAAARAASRKSPMSLTTVTPRRVGPITIVLLICSHSDLRCIQWVLILVIACLVTGLRSGLWNTETA